MYWFVWIVIGLVFLLQLPLLVDFLRVVVPGTSITRFTSKLTSYLLVYFVNCIFVVVLGYFFLIFLPLTVTDPYSVKGICHVVFAMWIWINVFVNYHMAVFVNPGKMTASSSVKEEGRDPNENGKAKVPTDPDPPVRHGLDWRPKRTHYCRECKAEVSFMDHHCPFTGNCVGENNFSYFLLGLTYSGLGLAYAACMSFSVFRDCVLSAVWAYLRFGKRRVTGACTDLSVHSLIFVPVFLGLMSVVFLLVYQWLLVLSDVPTFEFMKNMRKMPVFTYMWQRMVGKKFLEPDSRFNVLLLKTRPNPLWFLLPVRNCKSKQT